GPQRNAQRAAETSCATSDRPMLCPYSFGSMTLLQTVSRPRYRASTASGWPQPPPHAGAVATENTTGGTSPTQVPMYGTYRMRVAMKPHRTEYGTPRANRPTEMIIPNAVFTIS